MTWSGVSNEKSSPLRYERAAVLIDNSRIKAPHTWRGCDVVELRRDTSVV